MCPRGGLQPDSPTLQTTISFPPQSPIFIPSVKTLPHRSLISIWLRLLAPLFSHLFQRSIFPHPFPLRPYTQTCFLSHNSICTIQWDELCRNFKKFLCSSPPPHLIPSLPPHAVILNSLYHLVLASMLWSWRSYLHSAPASKPGFPTSYLNIFGIPTLLEPFSFVLSSLVGCRLSPWFLNSLLDHCHFCHFRPSAFPLGKLTILLALSTSHHAWNYSMES